MKLVRVNHPVYNYNAVDRLLGDFFNQGFQSDRLEKKELAYQPATNLFEDDASVGIELLIPGYEKEQVKILVENGLLVVKGEVEKQENQNPKQVRVEFEIRNFEKKFKLSEKLDAEKISASFKNGILKIEILKKEEAVPQKREIEIA